MGSTLRTFAAHHMLTPANRGGVKVTCTAVVSTASRAAVLYCQAGLVTMFVVSGQAEGQ
jgi:hypothetical protein